MNHLKTPYAWENRIIEPSPSTTCLMISFDHLSELRPGYEMEMASGWSRDAALL
jgi:hypothetical protein